MRYRFQGGTFRKLNDLHDQKVKPLHPTALGCFIDGDYLIVILPGDVVPAVPGVSFVACELVHYPIIDTSRTLTIIASSARG